MRRTYHDITEMVGGRETPSLQRYIPALIEFLEA
jgi:hypothetical protein